MYAFLTGFTFGIPDSVLGLTFLSVSVTLPDVMAAVLVVRKGYGDMAVCYILGTNIFEVLVGLGFPWFIQTILIKPGTTVELQSSGEGILRTRHNEIIMVEIQKAALLGVMSMDLFATDLISYLVQNLSYI